MRVLVSGATGLIGSALVARLGQTGHAAIRLVRTDPDPGGTDVRWDPAAGALDPAPLEGLDAVVHLAGEDIASGAWTDAKKARIRASRVDATALLARTVARLSRPPAVLACASAVGYYGDRGDEVLTEESAAGTGFLASVCRDWEQAAAPASEAGIRVLHLRFGVVLDPSAGALSKMLGLFRKGMGGPIGGGRQYVSWIALDDAVGGILHGLSTPALSGAVNVAAPAAVTQSEFAATLGRVLGRPTLLSVPAFGVRLMLGEMAGETILASQRLVPGRLLATGYTFRWPALEPALRHLLSA